ncbi:MAG: hypothetical protein ACWA6R_00215 [Nitrosomonas sp.]
MNTPSIFNKPESYNDKQDVMGRLAIRLYGKNAPCYLTAKQSMRFTSSGHVNSYDLVNHLLKGINMMKKLVIIVVAIFIAGYVTLMVQYF